MVNLHVGVCSKPLNFSGNSLDTDPNMNEITVNFVPIIKRKVELSPESGYSVVSALNAGQIN